MSGSNERTTVQRRLPRIVILFLVLAGLLVFAGGRSAQAAPARPLTSCSTPCSGSITQSAQAIHGFESDFTIDNPSGNGFSYYTKYINLNNPNGDAIYVGIDKGNYCPNATQIEFFYFAHDADNVSNDVLNCFSMNANDINHTAHFALSYYASNGGGAFFWIQNTFTGDSPCPNACAVANPDYTATWNEWLMKAFIDISSFTNHEVWGGEWINQKLFNGTTWSYNTNEGAVQPSNPVQFYWVPGKVPGDPGANGGTAYSCVYPSGTTCTLGS